MKFPIPDTALDDRLAILGTAGSGVLEDHLIRDHDQRIDPSKLDCAYAAGFFDGEGSVCISRVRRKDCVDPVYVLLAIAAQVEPAPLIFLQNRWGGSVIRRQAKPPRQPFYYWSCQANLAADFLFDTLEYLSVKRERATLGITFQSEKAGQGRHHGNRNRAPFFEEFYRKMRAMNGNAPNDWVLR